MLRRFFKDIMSAGADLVAPRTCCCCGRRLHDDEAAICTVCNLALPRAGIRSGRNSRIASILSNAVAPTGVTAAWFHYDPASPYADIIRKAKYADRPLLAREAGRTFAKELVSDMPGIIDDIDVLLPVPMHISKQIRRGYNQSIEIAQGISEVTGIPVGDNLVARRSHATQTRRTLEARRKNISGIFECRQPEELAGLDIVLVDDVITSGATISECALAIGRSGARPDSIGALALGIAAGC